MSNVLSELDENQKLCLRLLHQGYTSKQIAQQTHLSAGTVDQYIFRANAILGVTDRREAARQLAAAEREDLLKQSQLKSEELAGDKKIALIAGQGEPLSAISAQSIGELSASAIPLGSDRGLVKVIERALAVVGGKPHELNFRQKLLATSWVALATGGTLSALVAIGYAISLLCTTIFVAQKGDRVAKLSIAGIWLGFCAAELASRLIVSDQIFLLTIASIETISFMYKIGMVHMSNRRWPIIVAGLHFNIVCSHISFIISPSFLTKAMYAASTIWAVPVLLIITLGIYMDNRWDNSTSKAQA